MKQQIIPIKTHRLSLDQIDRHAVYVMDKLREAGFVAYLVGGSVRDLLLNGHPKDYDISTSAKPEEIKKLFRNCLLIGRRFRLAHIRFGKKVLEVATFRAGDSEKEELILRDNQWGYPEEDALRRDFTINSLFYDPSNQTIIDYVGGYDDLKKRLLRTIGPPYARFKQDPVRMLRLLKFQARFGFTVDPDAQIALLECREEITKSSGARVLEEMLRMLESGAAQRFIQLITEHGLMEHMFPGIAHFIEKEKKGQEIYHLLGEIDRITQDPTIETFGRPILMSALIYPIIEKRLQIQYLDKDHTPHLGQIQTMLRTLLSEIFSGFFQLPRRLKISIHDLILNQYRLTPLHKRLSRKKRIPSNEEFLYALQFLSLRGCLEPGLQEIYKEWYTAYYATERKSLPQRKKKRPKRRRAPSYRNKANSQS